MQEVDRASRHICSNLPSFPNFVVTYSAHPSIYDFMYVTFFHPLRRCPESAPENTQTGAIGMDSHVQVGGRQGRIHLFCARLKSWPFNYAICWKRCARDQETTVRQLQEFSSVQEHDVIEVCCLKQQVSGLSAP